MTLFKICNKLKKSYFSFKNPNKSFDKLEAQSLIIPWSLLTTFAFMAAQYTQIESENKDSKQPKNLFAHFTNLLFSAQIFNNKQERNKSEGEEREAAEASKKQEVVKFSDPKPIAPPPMKLEVEDSEQNPAAR